MVQHYFNRKVYRELLEWKETSQGKSALLLEGARRVGKSTLVNVFAHKEYESCMIIDFNNAPKRVYELFDDYSDLNLLFLSLQMIYGVVLKPRCSVIVLDEVQACPRARQAIKYLVADGRYDYIETGSLIRLHQNVRDITIPSEEHRVRLHPMDFEEFMEAIGKGVSAQLLPDFLHRHIPMGPVLQTIMREVRLYMLVGGMPQAVCSYLDTNNMQMVDQTKREIISLYAEDFRKIDPKGKLTSLFNAIPAQLNKNARRYIPSSVVGSMDDNQMLPLLTAMEESQVVSIAYHANNPSSNGMPLFADYSRYKLYLADTGLFVTLAFWEKNFTENIIYQKLLTDKLQANLGYVYENLVAQMLTAHGDKLFYYSFPKDDKHFYEIDFLISRGNKLCPIEVKSGNWQRHESLDAFRMRFERHIRQSYILHTKDISYQDNIDCLPVCMTPYL